MNSRYKVIISNQNLYREVELAAEAKQVKLGTDIDCDVRLRRELFFGQIGLTFVKTGTQWTVQCSDNLYITVGDVRKLITKNLKHGDALQVRYQESDMLLFNMTFTLDFDYENKKYDTEIDISGYEQIVIGGRKEASVYISDEIVGSDYLILKQSAGRYYVYDNNTSYGVYVNGSRISKQKEIKNLDFFSIGNYSFYLKNAKLYTTEKSNVSFSGLNVRRLDVQTTHFEYPEYVRNTRVQYCIPEAEIEIKQPLPKPQNNKKNILFSLIPSLVMLVMMVVMRGAMGGGGSFVIYSACSMGIGIIMSVVTYFYDIKEFKKSVSKREAQYKEYIEKKEREVLEARQKELTIRNQIYESLVNSINEVLTYGARIFEKSVGDKDFLEVYLGTGNIEAKVPVVYTQQDFIDTEDPISLLPAQIEEKYHYIANAPVVSKFSSSNGVGIVGAKSVLYEVLKNVTLDLAIRHFYKEVKLYYVFDEQDANNLQWIRWLRHAYNDEIGIRNFMCDDESRKILLENLYAILSEREMLKKQNGQITFDINYVVFVLDSNSIRNHPVSKYIEKCNEYGFTFVFFEEYEEFIPKGCTEIIRLSDVGSTGVLLEATDGNVQTAFSYGNISDAMAEAVALKLGSVSVEEVSLESELTKSISMYEMLGIFSVDDLNLNDRWGHSQVFKSMAAPLGVKTKNETVYLDISDKANAHGPHGLVAGTTGSGKSEILQTYVLSMATLFHPYDVGFVIIDFKGGGMANQFKDLPHMMGAITNIDGREINRSLLSIKAELVKRQSLFAEAGVNHINDYIKLFKNGVVTQPLPHLIIIVDEFAELKAEFPDFMKELISAARIGRTLGVHLILATQKPAGVVDAQIWSNSKFKLCLKVQTKEDSNEVIKTPLAAEIVEPGRSYFQVGNNEIFELFQSAYSGVKVSDDDNKTKTFSIYSLNNWGKRTTVYTNKRKSKSDNAKNQLQTIVEYISSHCKTTGISALNGICLPPLPDIIKKEDLTKQTVNEQSIVVPIGVYDDPERQNQGNYSIDLSDSNTFIIGSAMSGKTTLLQTVLLQLMERYSPKQVNVYIIDCGNMTLKVFENSSIVGGVASASDEEKVQNLFKLLFRTMDERKKIFSEKGLGTHRAYLEAGYTDMPQIVLMIDNLAAFKEYYENLMGDFLGLSREANSLGLSIIATSAQTNAMNYKIMANFATRISLVCNDKNEYTNLFDRCRIEPKDVTGRGLCVMDKRILEFQAALCVEGDKEYIRVENIKKEIERCNHKYAGQAAVDIPVVPDIIYFDSIKHSDMYKKAYKIPLGIDYSSVQYETMDMLNMGLMAVVGKEKSGKTNFIKHIYKAISRNVFGSLTQAYVVDDMERTLVSLKSYGFVEKYTTDITDLEVIVDEIEECLKERQERCAEDERYSLNEEALILLTIDNSNLNDILTSDKALSTKLTQLVKQYKKYKFAIIVSNIENATVTFSAPEFIKFVKDNKRFVYFDELANARIFDVTVKQTKEHAKPLELGDAFVYSGGNVSRIKTIYLGEEDK